MKALSIKQPWAWLIVEGYKDVENRSWRTNYRGSFLVHASKKIDFGGIVWIYENIPSMKRKIDPFLRLCRHEAVCCGGIVGIAELVDCVENYNSQWFCGPYGFVIKNARPLNYKQCKGRLRFFDVTYNKLPKY